MLDVIVIGAGPAGVVAALRAADLGAETALVTRDEFGGMAANDGPVPVRTLPHAARLIREAHQLGLYGVTVSEPALDYSRLLARVRAVVNDVRAHSALRGQIDSLGAPVYEQAGAARFVDPHLLGPVSFSPDREGVRPVARLRVRRSRSRSRMLAGPAESRSCGRPRSSPRAAF